MCRASLVAWTHPHVLRELVCVGLDCSEHDGGVRPQLVDVKRALLRCLGLLDVAPTGKLGSEPGAAEPGRWGWCAVHHTGCCVLWDMHSIA